MTIFVDIFAHFRYMAIFGYKVILQKLNKHWQQKNPSQSRKCSVRLAHFDVQICTVFKSYSEKTTMLRC